MEQVEDQNCPSNKHELQWMRINRDFFFNKLN